MGKPIRILIAEDDPALREAIADLISGEEGFELVGRASDADGAIELAERERPDVALVDVKMPGGGGPRATREIAQRSPRTRVIALSAYEDRRTVLEMLRAGVVGYVVKGTPADQIVETVKRSVRGQGSLSVEVTADVIHELTTLLDRSESLNRELQQLNRTKSELIQILAHELFTPLSVIQGSAITLQEHGTHLTPEDLSGLVRGVASATERIRRLLGNLSAAARLDREGLAVATRPTEIRTVLDAAAAEFPGQAHRLRLPPEEATADRRAWLDADLATRSLVAVLENALALSPEEEPVEVEVRAGPGQLVVAVADRGPGVPDEVRDRIFEAFTQADQSTTRSHEGLGIGLFLVRRVMSAHGGRITLEPRAGGGSVFALAFQAYDDTGSG
ncbi:MAG: response regulator [Actinobacteria bacterium]|nr:response regulator [Actinomycetota bacterium]